MFGFKKMQDDIHSLFIQMTKKIDKAEIGECEKCGALVWKTKENQGESKIVTREAFGLFPFTHMVESIHRTYYCKTHMPKSKKKKET